MKRIVVLLFMMAAAGLSFGQIPASSPSAHRIEIVLERHVNGAWQPVDSRLVLEQNDHVRFRVRTNFSGYLYVTNFSTAGRYEVLFPTAEAGQDNKIVEGREYLIPSTSQGSFRITGPAGQEVVYWLISPGEIDNKSVPKTPPRRTPNLIPRCDDTIFRARGDCVDTSAGPKQVRDPNALPSDVAIPNAKSRELVFVQRDKSSVVASPTPLTGPVIYEFRLSHR